MADPLEKPEFVRLDAFVGGSLRRLAQACRPLGSDEVAPEDFDIGVIPSGFRDDAMDTVGVQSLVVMEDSEKFLVDVRPKKDENFLPIDVVDSMRISGHGDVTERPYSICLDCFKGKPSEAKDKAERYDISVVKCPRCGGERMVRGGCGTFKGAFMSEHLHHTKTKVWGCHHQGCPKCFRSWAAERSRDAGAFLWGISEATSSYLYHCVISLAPSTSAFKGWEFWLKRMKKFLERFHSGKSPLGYAYVLHPYRIRCGICGGEAPENRGKYGAKLGKCPKCKVAVWRWVFGPHIHLITNFYVNVSTVCRRRRFEKAQKNLRFKFANISQDNYKRARRLEYRGAVPGVELPKKKVTAGYIDSQELMESIVAYELGHAMWVSGKQHPSIVFVGDYARVNWKTVADREIVPVLDDNGDHFIKVLAHPVMETKDSFKIEIPKWPDGTPVWEKDNNGSTIFLGTCIVHCTCIRLRMRDRLHRKYERLDPLERGTEDCLRDQAPLEEFV